MYCTQCGQEMLADTRFCSNCDTPSIVIDTGASLHDGVPHAPESPVVPPQSVNTAAKDTSGLCVTDKELRDFIGPNAERYLARWAKFDPTNRIARPSWNWPACLFSVYWLAYRKMYWHSVSWSIAFLIAGFFYKEFLFTGPIILGTFANAWYYRFARRKILKIKSAHPDVESQHSSILRAGGTSKLGAMVSVFVYVALAVAVTLL